MDENVIHHTPPNHTLVQILACGLQIFTQSLCADKSVGLHTSVMMWLTSSLGPQAGRGSPYRRQTDFHSTLLQTQARACTLRHTLYLVRLCVSDPSLAPL